MVLALAYLAFQALNMDSKAKSRPIWPTAPDQLPEFEDMQLTSPGLVFGRRQSYD